VMVATVLEATPASALAPTLYAAASALGTGDCSTPANACTLTTALSDFVAGGTIELVTSGSSAHYVGTFALSTGTVGFPVTIEPAAGISDPILDGNNGSATNCPTTSCLASVLTVASGVYATVSGLTVENGLTAPGGNGGGIDNAGNLTLTKDIVTENVTGPGDSDSEENGGSGGGIYNTGTLALTDDTVANNQTGAGNSLGSITVTQPGDNDSVTIDNSANGADGGNGGGIDNAGALTLTDDTVSGNQTGGGGSVGNITITQDGQNDAVSIDGSEDGADGGNGGGLYNSGTLSLADDTVSGNQAGAGGSLAGISITQGAGSFASAGVLFSDSGANGGDGGGIYNIAALTLTNDTVADNRTGAGGNTSGVSFTLVQDGADAAAHADDGQGGGGGQGGDIDNGGTTNVAATIVASSGAGGDCAGTITDLGYNLADDSSCGAGNYSATLDTYLGSLAINGGPTQTIALLPGSPAIDKVPAKDCPSTDQRGAPRTAPCDIGAYDTDFPNFSAFSPVCATGTAYYLYALSATGDFAGLFCVNAAGTGTYAQYSLPTGTRTATGTGTVKVSGGTTAIAASGTGLALLGELTAKSSTFTETAPAPMKTGTFTLS
jgi:hypothetical protein